MKRYELLIYGIIASVISAVMLVIALGNQQYGFYDLLRIVVCFTGGLTAYVAFQYKSYFISTISVVVAMLFNPIIKVTLERETWNSIDIAVSLYFVIVATVFFMVNKEGKAKNNE